ncbi:hypothetical protein C0991_006658, partial [Blastosporella zonata]
AFYMDQMDYLDVLGNLTIWMTPKTPISKTGLTKCMVSCISFNQLSPKHHSFYKALLTQMLHFPPQYLSEIPMSPCQSLTTKPTSPTITFPAQSQQFEKNSACNWSGCGSKPWNGLKTFRIRTTRLSFAMRLHSSRTTI